MNVTDSIQEVCRGSVKEADRLILEYMKKKNLTIDDLQGNVAMQREEPAVPCGFVTKTTYWYKGDMIMTITQKIDITKPYEARATMVIEKGDW